MTKKKTTRKKSARKFRLPKNLYERNLTAAETQRLLKDGWQAHPLSPCPECNGHGCKKCGDTGLYMTMWKGDKIYFGTPTIPEGMVGAQCSMYYTNSDLKLHMRVQGAGGSASVAFHYKQLFNMMTFLVNTVGNPNLRRDGPTLGVEASLRGPPAMQLAALGDRVTVATSLTELQRTSIQTLEDAGLISAAQLLKSAYEHEIFRGDCEEMEKARAKIGDIEPGTIFERRGDTLVTGDGEVMKLDPCQSAISQLAGKK